MPSRDECYFFHSMQYPGGESVPGYLVIPDFANYVGGYDVRGKSVLDVGTASGYVCFSAEAAGAEVTALDAMTAHEFRHVPFAQSPAFSNPPAWRENWTKENLIPLKKSWWYSWHKTESKARCVYAPIPELYEWDAAFDVVIAGAILLHISDPVYAIGAWAKVAREAIILPYTDFVADDALFMQPYLPWTDPGGFTLGWWRLSSGLFKQIFNNLGFDVTFKIADISHYERKPDGSQQLALQKFPTIIARRQSDTQIRPGG
jgi:SAM-dependent methyltransferase